MYSRYAETQAVIPAPDRTRNIDSRKFHHSGFRNSKLLIKAANNAYHSDTTQEAQRLQMNLIYHYRKTLLCILLALFASIKTSYVEKPDRYIWKTLSTRCLSLVALADAGLSEISKITNITMTTTNL